MRWLARWASETPATIEQAAEVAAFSSVAGEPYRGYAGIKQWMRDCETGECKRGRGRCAVCTGCGVRSRPPDHAIANLPQHQRGLQGRGADGVSVSVPPAAMRTPAVSFRAESESWEGTPDPSHRRRDSPQARRMARPVRRPQRHEPRGVALRHHIHKADKAECSQGAELVRAR
jgi:hypothetical protein